MKKILTDLLLAVMAGLSISIGCIAFLSSQDKAIGAAAFAVTLLTGAVVSAAYPALEELREEKAFFRSAAAEQNG